MANNPITTPLPADLPTNWTYGQTIGASGTDVGLTAQHGYNYLMQQVNAAQQAATQIGQAFSGLPSLGSDGKIPATQLPAMNYDPAGSAATVQTNLTNHINNKSNPHNVTATQIGALGLIGGSEYDDLNNLPAQQFVLLTNSSGVAGLPDGWPQGRNTMVRFYTNNLAYSLDLLASYQNKKLAYRFSTGQWAILATQADLDSKVSVQTGSYVGTGGLTLNLNLPIVPKVLILSGSDQNQLIITRIGEYYCVYGSATTVRTTTVTEFGQNMSISGESTPSAYNESGETYFWTALY